MMNIFSVSGLTAAFSLEEWRLSTFIACVASHHHDNPYHNVCHTCLVLQAAHMVVHATQASGALPQTAQLALLIAALCHDLDHDGACCYACVMSWRGQDSLMLPDNTQ